MLTLPQPAQNIIDILKSQGFAAYAVGGSVRDALMGQPTHGWDFTTSATPEEILKLFPDSFYDNQFGTVGVKIYAEPTNENPIDIYEVTTFRSEKGYTDHRHPDKVTWGKTLEEDLSRRDFTVNAIATDGLTIIDPYNGQTDIKNKLIRAVGEAEARFTEDALRMMRAVRLAATLGFLIDPASTAATQKLNTTISNISWERIRDELLKILSADFAADGILLLKNTGLLAHILPELNSCFDIGQKSPKRHHLYDVGTHLVMSLKHCPSADPVTRLATLIHDIGKPQTVKVTDDGVITFYNHEIAGARLAKAVCYRLRLSRKQADKIWHLVRWHQFTVDERQTDSALRRFIRNVTLEYLEDMLSLRIGDRLGGGARETSWRLELFKKRLAEVQVQPFSVADLKISGFDVMRERSLVSGPAVGKFLSQLFSEVEAGTLVNEPEPLLTRLRELKSTII